MATEVLAQDYKGVIVFLTVAAVVVPVFHRFRLSPVLGFLLAGVLMGPDGLGRFVGQLPWMEWFVVTDDDEMRQMAELGVVFLLFSIGLELSWERLKSMRRLILGLGMVQIVASAVVLGALAWLMGQAPASAAVIGMALALSSTAVVLPVLAERKKLQSPGGRGAFAVLLAQDIAVAPILITVGVLGAASLSPNGLGGPPDLKGILTLIPALIALFLLVLGARLFLRPLFRSVARVQSRELFMAACLLIVLVSGFAAVSAGLSMALGAFIAGLLLAETEYRREVEVVIEPFKGLLLGLFFVSVGVGMDLDAIIAEPGVVFGMALAILLIKGGILYLAARAFGLGVRPALEVAAVLGPAGEFAFVVLEQAMGGRLVPTEFGQALIVSATLSLFFIPLLASGAERLGRWLRPDAGLNLPTEAPQSDADEADVLVMGYGRVGKLVGEMLAEHKVHFAIVDSNPGLASRARQGGKDVWFGDATRPEFLERFGIETARAVVVTFSDKGHSDAVVRAVRAIRPDIKIIVRALDASHAMALYELGATDAVPETIEASLQLAENTLVAVGVPMGLVLASVHEKRDDFRKQFAARMPEARPIRDKRSATASADSLQDKVPENRAG